MKITTFNPQIITKNPEPIVKLFEELGFEVQHNPKNIGELNVRGIRMKDANGFHLDIGALEEDGPMDQQLAQDRVAMRMNVDDFDEAYELLKSRGFVNVYGDNIVNTPFSKSAVVISPSGFAINLVQHIKD